MELVTIILEASEEFLYWEHLIIVPYSHVESPDAPNTWLIVGVVLAVICLLFIIILNIFFYSRRWVANMIRIVMTG